MVRILQITLICLVSFTTFGQKFQVTGTLKDSLNQVVDGATVVLLKSTDSTLVKFALTDVEGKFKLKDVDLGKYIMQMSHLGYNTFNKTLEVVGPNSTIDVGELKMYSSSKDLQEVVVYEDRIPILFKNDTIEYNASSFKTGENSDVEELLSKLPGVHVDKDGNAKAHGKKVEKVLVDGKEFFGSDTKLATKNLPSDVVDAVQVFDDKTEFSKFAGIDDGAREKTINLKLKEDKKAGVFGTLRAGYGSEGRFEGKGNANKFTKNYQASIVGVANNTNQGGFSFNDYINFIGGMRGLMQMAGSEGSSFSMNPEDMGMPLDLGNNEGEKTTYGIGGNLNYTISPKTDLRSHYFFYHFKDHLREESEQQSIFGNTRLNTEDSASSRNMFNNHSLSTTISHNIDSNNQLDFNVQGLLGGGISSAMSRSRNSTINNLGYNLANRDNIGDAQNMKINGNLGYRVKLGEPGRVANINVGGSVNRSTNGRTMATQATSYFDTVIALEGANQLQEIEKDRRGITSAIKFYEPIKDGHFLTFRGNISAQRNTISQMFYDNSGATAELNQKLTGKFQNNVLNWQVAAGWRRNIGKRNLMILGGVQTVQQSNHLYGEQKTNNNLVPYVNLTFDSRSSREGAFELRFNSSLQAPSLDQLSPIINNLDPTYLTIGNPDLVPEYAQELNFNLYQYDPFSFTSFYLDARASYITNKITSSIDIDPNLVRISKPINSNRAYEADLGATVNTPIKPIKAVVNVAVKGYYNRQTSLLNKLENEQDLYGSSVDVSLANRKEKDKVDIRIGAKISYNLARHSLNTGGNYFDNSYYADCRTTLPKGFEIKSGLDISQLAGQAFDESQNLFLWKASVSKSIWKKRLQVVCSVNDILNQNRGVRRFANGNVIGQREFNTVGRFAMVSLVFNLSKFANPNEVKFVEEH